jgi:hypothetical protein
MIKRNAFSVLALVCCCAVLPAATADWSLGKAIDCPLPVAMPSKAATRTVVFPFAVVDVPTFWSQDEQLYTKSLRNTLVMQLRDPSWQGTLQVFDDKGNLYLLNVRSAKAGETVDESLIIRPVGTDSAGPGAGAPPADSDGAVTDMMAYMVAGGKNANYSASLVTRVVDDKLVVGRRIFEDDTMVIDLVKVFQGPKIGRASCRERVS